MSQHSSPIVWLLLAATLSVDAVAFYWLVSTPWPHYASMTYEALVVAQISVVCIWSTSHPLKTWWTRLAPWLAVVVATLANLMALVPSEVRTSATAALQSLHASSRTLETVRSSADRWLYWIWIEISLAQYLLHAALLVAVLWLFQRTSYWRRRTGITAEWRFSLRQLLASTTIVALLAAVIGDTYLRNLEYSWVHFIFIGSWTVIALAAVFIWNLAWNWLLRLAMVMAVSLLLGNLWYTVSEFSSVYSLFVTHYFIQGMVLSAWLGLGLVLPLKNPNFPT
jgi:hypothetical protein